MKYLIALLLCLPLLQAAAQDQPTYPTPVNAQGHVLYQREVDVQGVSANRLLNAAKAWLLVNGTINPDMGMVDDMVNDLYSGRFYLRVQGLNTVTDKVAKGDITFTLQINAYDGKYTVKLEKFAATDPLRAKPLHERYMLNYEDWKREYTIGLSSEEKRQEMYRTYQAESQDALKKIDLAVHNWLDQLVSYTRNNN